MNTLQVYLLNNVQVFHQPSQTKVKLSRHTQALLAFLLLQPERYCTRATLVKHFWANQAENGARRSLSTALWRLRRALEPDHITKGRYLVTTPEGEIGFNWNSHYWIDLVDFENTTKRFLAKPVENMNNNDILEIERIIELYKGDFLEGFNDSWAEWAIPERERLRLLYVNTLTHLMTYYKHHKAYQKSLHYGKKLLHLEPLYEEFHREVIRFYLHCGQRIRALDQYEKCSQMLQAEYNLEPMPETQALYFRALQNTVTKEPHNTDLLSTREMQQQLLIIEKNVVETQQQIKQMTKQLQCLVEATQTTPHFLEEDLPNQHFKR